MLKKIHIEYWKGWVRAGKPVPLIVSKSRYDHTTVSWEVMWEDRKWCWLPIGEFTTWNQAQMWADTVARLASKDNKERSSIGEEEEDT